MDRQEIIRELSRIIRSKGNDAVKLAYLGEDGAGEIGRLDLRGVAELKRSEKGCFEVRFVDKLKAIELLQQLIGQDDAGNLDRFLDGLREGEDG